MCEEGISSDHNKIEKSTNKNNEKLPKLIMIKDSDITDFTSKLEKIYKNNCSAAIYMI